MGQSVYYKNGYAIINLYSCLRCYISGCRGEGDDSSTFAFGRLSSSAAALTEPVPVFPTTSVPANAFSSDDDGIEVTKSGGAIGLEPSLH